MLVLYRLVLLLKRTIRGCYCWKWVQAEQKTTFLFNDVFMQQIDEIIEIRW